MRNTVTQAASALAVPATPCGDNRNDDGRAASGRNPSSHQQSARGCPAAGAETGAIAIRDAWGDEHHFADQVHETERPTHSQLLGPDGEPLRYRKQRLGFDLRPRGDRQVSGK